MSYTVTLIPGDGIGPEVAAAAVRVLGRGRRRIDWETEQAGLAALARVRRRRCPSARSTRSASNKVALKGPPTTPDRRRALARSTWRCARRSTCTPTCGRSRSLPGVKTRFERRRSGRRAREHRGPLRGLEHVVVPGVVESIKIITEKASTRIARVRLRVRAQARPQEGHRGAQGQHHEAVRRPVPATAAREVAQRATRTSTTTS